MCRYAFYRSAFIGLALLSMDFVVAARAVAVTFTVNSTLDEPDDLTIPGTCHAADGKCTLRAAVMQANRTSGAGATIMLPAGTYYLTIPVATGDFETSGDLDLNAPPSGTPFIAIVGAGAATTIIDASQLDRAFNVHFGRTATISGVTVQNGYVTVAGGGIANAGLLTVSDSTIANNQTVGANGGGILNSGTLTVINSTLSDNIAASWGGGIANANGGFASVTGSTLIHNHAGNGGGIRNDYLMTLTNCTIFNNFAIDGAGIWNDFQVDIINSTISANQATNNGGGIYSNGYTKLFNATVIFNSADVDADAGGGIGAGAYQAGSGNVSLRNSVIAGNDIQNAPVYDDCAGQVYSYGRNLFWNVPNCTITTSSGSWGYLNALNTFGPLRDNGGPTKTHALLPGSNAIDGGDPDSGCVGPDPDFLPLATDQRGFAWVVGIRCDVGAFEYSDVIFANGFD